MNLTFIEKAIDKGLILTVRVYGTKDFKASVGTGPQSHNALGTTVIDALARLEHYLASL